MSGRVAHGLQEQKQTDPTTNGGNAKMEAQSEYVRIAYTFLHVLAPT